MKRNALTLVVGVILLAIFFLLLFTFQVRQTEMVVVTTFDRPSEKPIDEPGLYFKWPFPIQNVYRFDKRVHTFEDAFEQMLTRDGNNILANVFVGWSIDDPIAFFNSFPQGGTDAEERAEAAEPALKSIVRSTKQAVIGQHPFSDFVSSNPEELKFAEVEQEILQNIRAVAADKYGVEIEFVGIKKLGLPESVTQKVFERMTAERQREVDRIQSEGEREAMQIRSAAERDRAEILAKARAEATIIKGAADAEATKHFDVFKENPELAVFLLKLNAVQAALAEGATMIVDGRTPPFDMLVPEQGTDLQAPAPAATQPPVEQGNGRTANQPSLSQNSETR